MSRFFWLPLVCLVLFPPAIRAESTSSGLTGLGEMRTPEILTGSRSQFTLSGRYSLLSPGLGKRLSPALGYTQGLGDAWEVGLQIPYLKHDTESGLGNLPLAGKYQFLNWSGLRLAVIAQVELPTAPQAKDYGTGKAGFGGEFSAMLSHGPIGVVTNIGYGKSDYCRRCTFTGDQRRTPAFIPILKLSEGLKVSWSDASSVFTELHFTTAANGSQSGFLHGDPDVYGILGARTDIAAGFSATAYAGVGVPQASANTKRVGALLLHYTLGTQPPEAQAANEKPVNKTPGLRVDVIDGCSNSASAELMVALLKDNQYDARLVGKMRTKVNITTVSFVGANQPAAMDVSRLIPGNQKMTREKALPAGVALRVVTGCFLGAGVVKAPAPAVKPAPRVVPPVKKAPVAPLAPRKPKEKINVAVVNGCSRPGLAEENATILIVDGWNVSRMGDASKPGNAAETVIRYKSQYLEDATALAAKLSGAKKFVADDTLPEDADILVTIGCGK